MGSVLLLKTSRIIMNFPDPKGVFDSAKVCELDGSIVRAHVR